VAEAVEALLINGPLEARRWQVLNDFYSKTVELYDRHLGVLRIIVLVMVMLSVANTVNLTIFERTGELGTMRALGNRSRFVFRVLMMESLMLGTIGVTVGVVLGVSLGGVISMIGIPMPPPPNANLGYTAQIRLLPSQVAAAALVGLLATVGAFVVPALRASRIPVAEALRYNV